MARTPKKNNIDLKTAKEGKPSKNPDEIWQTRSETLHAAWINLVAHYESLALVPRMNTIKVEKTIDDYIATRDSFRQRYKIEGRIQRHKIAGLMASAILKHKPAEVNDRDHSPCYESTQGNELLAFWHGIAVCAEGATADQIESLIGNPKFGIWRGDLLAVFEHNAPSPECFAVLFETISLTYFPINLERVAHEDEPISNLAKKATKRIR